MNELRDPTDAEIQAGYYISKAKASARKYGGQAADCATVAAKEAKANGQIPAILVVEDSIEEIREATANYAKRLTEAHKELRRRLKRSGVREITDEDYARFGVGGGGR